MAKDEQKAPESQDPEVIQETQAGDALAEDVLVSEDTVESLSEALEEAEATIADLHKQLAELGPRAQAEILNQRRRAEQEVDKARKYALEKFAAELLPVVDSLERAIEACQIDNEAIKPLRDGVEMTHKMFIDSIAKFNVEVVDPQGEVFNPEHHQAMSMVEAEGTEPNTVVAVMQKGYLLNGRLIRPAMVMVAKA